MAVTKRLRYEILKRDNHACRYCGAAAPEVKLTVDHVVPKALGGSDDPSNLVASCGPCNSGKSSSSPDAPLVDDVAADALRWSRARTSAIDSWRDKRLDLIGYCAEFAEAWGVWSVGEGEASRDIPKASDWESSIERWLDEGLHIDDLVSLIPKAMHNRKGRRGGIVREERWQYYCGVVWRTLDQIQEQTKGQLEEPAPVVPAGGYEIHGVAYDTPEEADYADAFWNGAKWAARTNDRGWFFDEATACRSCHMSPRVPEGSLCLHCNLSMLPPDAIRCGHCWYIFQPDEDDHPRCAELELCTCCLNGDDDGEGEDAWTVEDYVPRRTGICPQCNEPLELPLDECPSCQFRIPYPGNVHLSPGQLRAYLNDESGWADIPPQPAPF